MKEPDDGFSNDEVKLLAYLAKKCCMTRNTAKRYEAIKRDWAGKIDDLDSVLKRLEKCGAVAKTKKGKAGKDHYYASHEVLGMLKELGLWSPGRMHPL